MVVVVVGRLLVILKIPLTLLLKLLAEAEVVAVLLRTKHRTIKIIVLHLAVEVREDVISQL
jgi:hypothetical protein